MLVALSSECNRTQSAGPAALSMPWPLDGVVESCVAGSESESAPTHPPGLISSYPPLPPPLPPHIPARAALCTRLLPSPKLFTPEPLFFDSILLSSESLSSLSVHPVVRYPTRAVLASKLPSTSNIAVTKSIQYTRCSDLVSAYIARDNCICESTPVAPIAKTQTLNLFPITS